MWKYLYVVCPYEPYQVRKLGAFIHENTVYDINICDFGSGNCTDCRIKYFTLLKEHPELLNEPNNQDNPLRL